MAIRESELRPVLEELAEKLVGKLLSNIWQPSRTEVVLGFSCGTMVLLCPRGPDARVHTVVRRPKNPKRPYSFQGACRAHLRGPLTGIEQVPGDRVVDFHFQQHRLHLRLTGNIGGLWLLEGDAVIAAYDGPADALPELRPGGQRDLEPRMEPIEGSWDRGVWRFFRDRLRARRLHEVRIEVGRGVRRERKRLARLLVHLNDDLGKADKAPLVREQADALAAALHTVEGGLDHVELPSLERDVMLKVPLLVGKAPSKSMEHLYRSARRLERMGDAVLERIERTEQDLGELEALEAQVDTLDLEALEGLAPRFRQRRGEHQQPALPGVTEWTGPTGQRILVGRDSKANRRLTFQVGKGADWWMHQRGKPGSHVLLKLQRGQTPPLELLLAAAQITAVHAGVPEGARCEVQYARIRDIRSIPGTEAMVRVHDERVLEVVRDPTVLTGWTRR